MIFRNSEHYYDPTAGQAIANVMGENRELPDSLQTEPMQENWEDLANAIIIQQAEDYRAYRKQLRENPRMEEEKRLLIEVEILGIQMFFLSDWFCLLTKVDGGKILERLKKEEDENDSKGISAAGLSA
jgi:hypothetical protein